MPLFIHRNGRRGWGARCTLLIAGTLAGACRGPETFSGNLDAAAVADSLTGTGGAGAGGAGGDATGGDAGTASDVSLGNPDLTEDVASDAADAVPPDGPEADGGVIPDPNLVGYWKFDEGVGNTLHDSSSKHYDAAVKNQISWAAGAANLPKLKFPDATAVTFGGGYAVATTSDLLPSLNHTQTVSVWVNLKSVMGSDQVMVAISNGQAMQSLALGLHANQISAWASGPRPLVMATPPKIGSWHHVAYTYDGTTHLLYVDGIAAGGPGNMAPDGSPITQVLIGSFGAAGSPYQGMLDDLRIYAVALTAAQVARLAGGEDNPGEP